MGYNPSAREAFCSRPLRDMGSGNKMQSPGLCGSWGKTGEGMFLAYRKPVIGLEGAVNPKGTSARRPNKNHNQKKFLFSNCPARSDFSPHFLLFSRLGDPCSGICRAPCTPKVLRWLQVSQVLFLSSGAILAITLQPPSPFKDITGSFLLRRTLGTIELD